MLLTASLFTLTGGIFGTIPRLLSSSKKERIAGMVSLLVLITGVFWQFAETYQREQSLEQLRVFTQSGLTEIDEASGGALDPKRGLAYLVDDEESKIFVFAFDETSESYVFQGEFPLYNTNGERYKNNSLEDLEAAAYYGDRLYLLASHSNRRSGVESESRQLFLEVSLEDGQRGQVVRTANLRSAIRDRLRQPIPQGAEPLGGALVQSEEQRLEVMNIEGLAIDRQGRAYLGFRNPLIDGKYALVLRASLDELFSEVPSFEAMLLTLTLDGKYYGINDLALDGRTNEILILAGSSHRFEYFSPGLWRWKPGEQEGFQLAQLTKAGLMKAPPHFRAKPEVLLVADTNRVTLFADAEAYGGQKTYRRSELGLPE